MKQKSSRKGFTLIEMLIVIAIIGILSSIVLVGLGPVQRRGRDARRQSDLRGVQNGLELYYNKCGYYPGPALSGGVCNGWAVNNEWKGLTTALTESGIGLSKIPNDPTGGKTYYYGSDGTNYILGAELEDPGNPALKDDEDDTMKYGVNCSDTPDPIYCITF